jgi:predicted DNA-binding transcriptional regulator YafY
MASESKRRDKQVVRIIGILGTLLAGGRPSIQDLARRFKTRRETIYRDLRSLEDAGYPIVGDEDGHLSRPQLLTDGKRTPQVRFTPEELNALDWAAAQASAGPFSEALDIARQKLQAISAALGQEAVGVAGVTDSWGPTAPVTVPEVLLRLAEAILRHRVCTVTYQTPDSPKPKTYAYHPYRLLNVAGVFYCAGKVPPHEGPTILATHRIGAIELTPDSFTADKTINLSRHRQEAFGVIWEEPTSVVLRFRADQAPYVAERQWHPSQKLKRLSDGRLELTFRAGGSFEIRRWILGWGDAVEVIEPDELRRQIREDLCSLTALYDE